MANSPYNGIIDLADQYTHDKRFAIREAYSRAKNFYCAALDALTERCHEQGIGVTLTQSTEPEGYDIEIFITLSRGGREAELEYGKLVKLFNHERVEDFYKLIEVTCALLPAPPQPDKDEIERRWRAMALQQMAMAQQQSNNPYQHGGASMGGFGQAVGAGLGNIFGSLYSSK